MGRIYLIAGYRIIPRTILSCWLDIWPIPIFFYNLLDLRSTRRRCRSMWASSPLRTHLEIHHRYHHYIRGIYFQRRKIFPLALRDNWGDITEKNPPCNEYLPLLASNKIHIFTLSIISLPIPPPPPPYDWPHY